MSRTQHTRKPKVERVKEHPYNDVTAAWLREDAEALDALRAMQADHNEKVRKLALVHANAWRKYCEAVDAPEAVISQARANVKLAEGRVNA